MSSAAPLFVENCSKRYRTGTLALAGVDLEVGSGELVALLGPNGSGKSTLVHGLVGLHALESDVLAVCGRELTEPESLTEVGFVPDELPIPLSLSGREYLDHLDRLRARSAHTGWRQSLITELGLGPHLGKFIGDMSHGTKKKLQLVAAVQHLPKLLVLDEPFRGLDPRSSVVIRAVIETLRARGTGVLVATHDVLAAERWFDRVVLLHDGSVVAVGAPADLISASTEDSLEGVVLEFIDAPSADAISHNLARTLLQGAPS